MKYYKKKGVQKHYFYKVRNPIAHNNPGLSQSDIDVAYDYCKEICTAIDEWKRNNPE